MKVLVIGYPKTGTKTLGVALTELGYKVYDYHENAYYLYEDWMKIFTDGGTKEDFYRMYKNVDVACDSPACVFWKEILEVFPDMKMIFMRRRSEDEWYRSLAKQIEVVNSNYTWKFITTFSPSGRRTLHFGHYVNRITLFGPSALPFHKTFCSPSSSLAKLRYRLHNATVMMEAPKEQMMEFNLSDGWEPLCKFLEKPIPDIAFPHKNKNATLLKERLETNPILIRLMREAVIGFSLSVAAISAGGYLAYNYYIRELLTGA